MFLVACAVLGLGLLSNTILSRIIPQSPDKIVDLAHTYLPKVQNTYISDVSTVAPIIYFTFYGERWMHEEYCVVAGLSYFLRGICMVPTVLPPLNINKGHRFGGLLGTGTEYIYSGHAIHHALLPHYLRLITGYHIILFWTYSIFSSLLVILSQNHYTIDVVLAWLGTLNFKLLYLIHMRSEWCTYCIP